MVTHLVSFVKEDNRQVGRQVGQIFIMVIRVVFAQGSILNLCFVQFAINSTPLNGVCFLM